MNLTIIQSKIYEIRGHKVMFDFDLAELYQTETKRLKEAVRRNLKRFPTDFMFELTKEEFLRCNFTASNSKNDLKSNTDKDFLRTQNASLNKSGRGKHSKYLPFAFTEHGVTMLASVLSSDKAIEMNIAIVRAFIALKQLAIDNKDFMEQLQNLRNELHQRIDVHDAQLNQIYEAIENMLDDQADKKDKEIDWENRERIGFKK
jgi:phage regulator Rha-like protein